MVAPGRIIILNGAPRSGKSSIAKAIQANVPGHWLNLGVDVFMQATPPALLPGIGLRPGGERPDLEPFLPGLYAALYDSIAAHARRGFDVVADLGHHDDYAAPLHILPACARQLAGLTVMFVGVECAIGQIMERRNADPQNYAHGDGIPPPVQRWQDAVNRPGIYDLRVDTTRLTPQACAALIAEALEHGLPAPTAFARLSQM